MIKPHLEKVLKNMNSAGLAQLLVCAPMSVMYLTGCRVSPGERLLALIIEASGEVKLVSNKLFALTQTEGCELIEYADTDDTAQVLSECVKDGVLGVDKEFKCGFALPLLEKRRGLRLTVGSLCVDRARMIKSPEEIDKMRLSSRKNDFVLRQTYSAVKTGVTEREVADAYRANLKTAGAQCESFESLICFGANCAEPHHETDDTVLAPGDSVILDVGLLLDGYCSDMTRTLFFGTPTDEQKRIYELVRRANAAGRAAVRPGVPLKEVDAAARRVIEEAGYGKYFIHRTGHNIGTEVHEYPDVSASSTEVCTPGMVFSVEPGIYLPGKTGVRTEDLVAVTEDGSETLNTLPRELICLQAD
ncbi:MAG: aminopeptidase P family protein [Clostridia bacterium]|nr:aminopeptidase P family protein [Clostridia bacterium]